MNNIPVNLYPKIASVFNGKQLAKLSSASPNFFRWLKTQPRLLGKMKSQRRQNILSRYPHVSNNNKRILAENNYPKWRAQAYLRHTVPSWLVYKNKSSLVPELNNLKTSGFLRFPNNVYSIVYRPTTRNTNIRFPNRPTKTAVRLALELHPYNRRKKEIFSSYYFGKWKTKK